MTMPNVAWLVNNTTSDGANTGNALGGAGGSGSNWVVVDRTNDSFTFLDTQQTDGDSRTGTRYGVIIPTSGSSEAPKTFLDDYSADILDQIPLAGTTAGGQSGGNTRYVFAIYFDAATATIPYLEAWDDSDHDSTDEEFIGGGTPASSTIKAVATTNGVPGSATWTGTPLAGTSSRIALDTGALSGAQNVYFNIKQVIPSTFSAETNAGLVLTLRFTYS